MTCMVEYYCFKCAYDGSRMPENWPLYYTSKACDVDVAALFARTLELAEVTSNNGAALSGLFVLYSVIIALKTSEQ